MTLPKIHTLSKVAVTGANGHIGNVLCRKLIERNVVVKALVREDRSALRGLDLDYVTGDLFDVASLERLCDGCSTVFHLAAKISIDRRQDEMVRRTNVNGTANLIAACRSTSVRRLVHFSSIHAGDPQQNRSGAISETVKRYVMAYDESKTSSETLIRNSISTGLEPLVIVPTAVIGPGDYRPSLLGRAMIKISQRRLPMLLPFGYNFVDVRDVVEGAIRAAEISPVGGRYVLSGHWATLKELAELIGHITQKKTTTWVGPAWVAYLGLPFITAWARARNEEPLYTRNSLAILQNAQKQVSYLPAAAVLGYSPRPLEETICDLFGWYHEHHLV